MDYLLIMKAQEFFGQDNTLKYKLAVLVLEADGYEPIRVGTRGVLHVIGRNTAYAWMDELGWVWDEDALIWKQGLPF